MQTQVVLNSKDDTEKLAREITGQIKGGDILALSGVVGAGKTTFVKAFAVALGIEKTVVSPTYTLLQPYALPKPTNGITQLIHIDAYRLENENELSAIGFEDFANDPHAIIVIEWAENVEKLLENRPVIWMSFEIENDTRICTIK